MATVASQRGCCFRWRRLCEARTRWTDAHAAIREALAFAERSRDRAAIAGLHEAQGQTYEMQRDLRQSRTILSRCDRGPAGCGRRHLGAAKTLVDLAFVAMGQQRLCRCRKDSARGVRHSAEARARQFRAREEPRQPGQILRRWRRSGGRRVAVSHAPLPARASRPRHAETSPSALNNLAVLLRERGDLARRRQLHAAGTRDSRATGSVGLQGARRA